MVIRPVTRSVAHRGKGLGMAQAQMERRIYENVNTLLLQDIHVRASPQKVRSARHSCALQLRVEHMWENLTWQGHVSKGSFQVAIAYRNCELNGS